MKDDEQTCEKIEEAVNLLKDAGLKSFSIVGFGYGGRLLLTETKEDFDFEDRAKLQGIHAEAQQKLTIESIAEELDLEEEGEA